MSSLKAWLQDPEDWKIIYVPRKKTLRKIILQALEPWLITIGFVAFIIACGWLVELIC